MKINRFDPPRNFSVGLAEDITISHSADVLLADNEQITLISHDQSEYDIVKKDWGYYATPSLNGRLQSFNLRTALIRNTLTNRYFIVLVHSSYQTAFKNYLDKESLEVVLWLDTSQKLDQLKNY